jgi:hypothetical protein
MWFVRWFLSILFLLYGVAFAALNLNQQVVLRFPWLDGVRDTGRIEVVVALILAMALGMLIWALVAFVGSLELRGRIRGLERRNRELKDELGRLRNLSILDDGELGSESATPRETRPAAATPRALTGDIYDDDDPTLGELPSARTS